MDLIPWTSDPGRAAIMTDFDGTLAPIVDDPERAIPDAGAVPVLRRLAARYATVAVVSGRPVRYLAERLAGVDGLVLAGLYGLERQQDGVVAEAAGAPAWRDAIAAIADRAEREAPPGVGVERKGLAVTLHVRTAPQHQAWIERFGADQAAAAGLVAHGGRMSVEVRPPVRIDKGTVVAELAAGAHAVCYFGDDVGDLPAFDALRRLRAEQGITTLGVAVRSPEMPDAMLAATDATVDGPAAVVGVLEALAG